MTISKKTAYLFFVNISVFILFLFLIEGVSRIVTVENETKALFNDKDLRVRGRPFVEHHSTRGFALKPGFKNSMYTVDQNGFRQDVFPKDTNTSFTLLALGESTTFGWMVHDNETYPYFLEKAMQQTKLGLSVVNGGVPSYSSAQVLAYLNEILDKHIIKPDLILINIFWNDIWYSTVENWHKDLLIYQSPPSWLSFLNQHSQFFKLMLSRFADNVDNHEKIDIFNLKALNYYKENIQKMITRCKEAHIPLILIEPPFDADHMPEEGLNEFHIRYTKVFFIQTARQYLKALHEVADINHIPVFSQELGIQNLHQKSLFLDALHPTVVGNKLMAKDISDKLKNELNKQP